MTSLSIVIPAYNEESGIADIVHRVLNVRPELSEVGIDSLELLVVDDGSSDETADLVRKMAGEDEDVRLICHAQNQGYGAALKTGFSQATGELIGFLDADGTYPPEYFPMLCQTALDGVDLVIGSRMAGSDSQMPATRRLGNLFFASLLSILGRQRVTDSASGMRVFDKKILDSIYPLPDGLNLTPVMSTRAIHENITIAEVPIPYSERVGASKLSVIRDGSVFLHSMLWTALMYNPVRILGIIGLIGIGISAVIGLGIVLVRLSGNTSLGPMGVSAIYVAVVAGFAGFNIFALGISFNYLVSLFFKQPVRQGLFGKPLFKIPLEHHFWWLGGLALLAGLALGGISFYLGLSGWPLVRLWLYGLASAMLILTGIQLIVYWVQLGILEDLSQRDARIANELLLSQDNILQNES